MQEFFRRFLRAATIEEQEDTARNARLLQLVLLSLFAFVILNSAGVFLIYKRKLAVSIILLALSATAGACFLLMCRGRVRLASAILVFGLWCIAATHVALNGGLRGPSSFFFLVVCVFAALLLGYRGVLTYAVLTIVATTGMLVAESTDHPMPQYFFVLPLPTFINFTVTLLFVMVPLNLLLSELKAALGLAQEQLKQREEADVALRESEDKYRDLVEHSEDLICTHDLAGNLLSVNDPPARVLGYNKTELLNRPLRDFVVPEARPLCDAYLSEIERKGFARGLLPVLTKSGEVRLWEYNNTLRRDGNSSTIIRGIAHDVTDQKRAESALRLSEEKFSKAFQCSPTIVSISTLQEWRFLDVNEAFERHSGYARDEIIGHTALELDLWVDPRQRESLVNTVRRQGNAKNFEIHFRTKSSQVVVILLSVELMELDSQQCLLAVGQDITDRKRVEAEQRRGEAYLAMGQRLVQMGILSWNPSSDDVYASQEFFRIFGLDPATTKLTREMCLQCIHPEDRSKYERVINSAVTGRRNWDMDYRIVLPDGSIKHIQGIGGPVLSESAEVLEFIATTVDITDRKRSEEELQQLSGQLLRLQDEERRKIARDLHDSTGQDLVALAATLSQLHDSIPSSARRSRKLCSYCQALTDHCIREVRTLSYVLHPPLLDEAGLEGALRHFIGGFAERTGIKVDLLVSPNFGRLAQDMELGLFRVVQESLINIQRHSGSFTAKIQLHRDTDKITLEVSDAGRGIYVSKQKQFATIPLTVGVGIPSMEERVKQVGGRLEFESSGSGTIVRAIIHTHD
jgi:PAS domain S-box-containing protein